MMEKKMEKLIGASLSEIIAIRHQIHQYPELKYEEHKTAELVAKTLASYGYEVQQGVGSTGVVAILDSGKPGKTVALRADMDALPVQEETGLEYASKIPGRMHACGHDGHTATLLLVAKVLKECVDQFSGNVKFIFQPAEEGGNGAEAMIKDGVLDNPKVDAIFGYHNIPSLSIGKVGVRSGCILVGSIWFQIDVKGLGGHSSKPDASVNPVQIGSLIVQALQNIVSSMLPPLEPSVLCVTQFHAGETYNVIPPTASIGGSIRMSSEKAGELIKEKITDIATAIAESHGGEAKVTFPVEAPATINDDAMTDLVKQTSIDLYGKENVSILEKSIMATEDFSFYLHKVPGCFFIVGNGKGKDDAYVHHPKFIFHDEVLPIAARTMATVAINFLRKS